MGNKKKQRTADYKQKVADDAMKKITEEIVRRIKTKQAPKQSKGK